jgi:hypothetical protein
MLETVFGERSDDPRFYSLNAMASQTDALRLEDDEEMLSCYSIDAVRGVLPPGILSQSELVLIGDLGADRPFALNYRGHLAEPRVVYLTTYNGWVEIAPNIETMLDLLGLSS